MTTNLVTTTPNHFPLYSHPSPVNSAATTPANNSPSEARLNHPLPLHNRQYRPSVVPFYMPAALRPTERPSKSAPPTPPRSVPGSPDTLTGRDMSHPISRRSTMDSSATGITKRAEDQWMKREHLGEVTGLPTRDHWKADSASSSCDSPTCRSSFGLFLRRHHCRHCGHVFCSSHTPYLVPLDQEARFHPEGIPSRACDLCWSAFQRWQESRSSRLCMIQHSLDSQENGDTNPNDSDRSDDSQDDSLKPALASTLNQNTEMAASVPRGWNWSTF